MTTVSIKATIQGDIGRVWETVSDVGNYSAWRSDLSKAEAISENKFIEYTKNGYPTVFTVTAAKPHKRWEFDMENSNMKGHWAGTFTSKGAETEIEFTECVEAKKFFMKPFVKGFLKKQQARFVADLKNALAE